MSTAAIEGRVVSWGAPLLALAVFAMGGCGDDDAGTNVGNDSGTTICGNGEVEPGEACDDGAENSDTVPDACRNDCRLAYCGDSVIDSQEQCDDGNTASGDGCDGDCRVETGWDCSGSACTPICGDDLAVGNETCDGTDLRGEDCVSIGQALGTLGCNALCEWDISGCTGVPVCGNGVVEGNEACDDGNLTPCDGCSATCTIEACGNGVLECDETCDDGDGNNADDCPDGAGGTCRPAECGDGHVQAGVDVCDDGNNTDGDGCSADCQSDETCGNGIIDTAAGEACDDGANNSDAPDAACRTDCQAQRCGDGIIDTGETCDDGANNSNAPDAACRTDCLPQRCGDGVVDVNAGETCDSGAANSDSAPDACRTTCVPASCGDGVTDSNELCDEGANNSDTQPDVCRTSCEWASCGDGVTDSGEECDEGVNNSNLPDAPCRPGCLAGGCEDGILDSVEECDDGNSVSWDGCTACAITEFQVNTYTSNHQQSVAIAAAADGSFVVVWTSLGQLGLWEEIYGQRFDSSGAPAGAEFLVNTHTTGRQYAPRIAMAASGQFAVIWYCQDRGSGYVRLYASDGTPSSGEIALGYYASDVAMADDGTFVVVYSGSDSGGSGVYGRSYSATGTALGGSYLVNTTQTGDQWECRIAMAADGTFVVTWTSVGQDGDASGVYGQRFSNTGAPAGSEFRVNTTTVGEQYQSAVSMADDGSFVVAWRGGADLATTDIFAQRFSSAGAPLGGELSVNTYTTGLQYGTDVYLVNDGSFVVVWTSQNQDGSGNGAFAQRYGTGGAALGGEFQLNVYTNNNQSMPVVDGNGIDLFAVAWSSRGQDGSDDGVFAQRYDAAGTPLGN